MTSWAGAYLGLRQADHGRDRDGVDCWGLVRLVYADELGIDLPSYTEVCPDLAERAELGALITGERDRGPWREVTRPEPFDVLLFRIGPHATHVAVAVDHRDMLHVHGHSESCIVSISDRWRKRLVGVYRYQPPEPVHVTEARGMLPDQMRRSFDIAATQTIAEIVANAFPDAPETVLSRVRVTMLRGRDWQPVPRVWWRHVRPHPGTHVMLRLVPGVGTFVVKAAFWLSSLGLATPVVNILAYGAGIAVTALGAAALNSLIPLPEVPEGPDNPETRYALQGWRNQATPGDPVPAPTGRIRVAPVFAMQPYQEIVGDDQFIRVMFCFGYGRLDISGLQIGDTPITEFRDIEIELREGTEADDPVAITPIQVLEQPEQVELVYSWPKDASGNDDESGGRVESPVTRTTASNAVRAAIVLNFPGGLFHYQDGDREHQELDIRIRQRLSGTETYTTVTTLNFRERRTDPFFRQYSWGLPSRGTWEVEITRVSPSPDGNPNRSAKVFLSAFQSYRPEYPIDKIRMPVPLALCSIKVRASYQLQGSLDDLNALVQRYAPDWDGTTWADGVTRNPASAYILSLQGPENPEPVPDDQIDWDAMADWHEFCTAKGLHYDRDQRRWESLMERLTMIAAAGRASPWHDGAKWSVVVDRTQTVERSQIAPHNSRNLQGSRSFLRTPDAVRVRFLDESNDYIDSEIIMPWLGKSAPYDLVEEWQKPGKTNAAEIQREIYRDMLVAEHRRDRWTVERDGAVRVETRGDWVWLTHPVLNSTQASAWVRAVQGTMIVLDAPVTMEDGQTYAIRFLDFDEADPVGQSVLTSVQTVAGTTQTLRITGSAVPGVGAMVMFGPSSDVAERALVLDIEPGEDFSATVTLTNAAPEIDTLTDAFVPSDWSPIVGQVVDTGLDPLAPVFSGIETTAAAGVYGTDARTLVVRLSSAPDDRALIAGFEIDHRLQGAGSWTTVAVTGGTAEVGMSYDQGDTVELVGRAIDFDGDAGPDTATATYVVGSDLSALPTALDLASITVTGGLGRAALSLGHSDPNTTSVQIFRTADGDSFDAATDVLGDPVTVASGATVISIDGDSTRGNALAGATWTAGGNWTGSGVPFSHSAGVESTLETPVAFTDAQVYRGEITVANRTAGSVTVRLTGDGDVAETTAITANGQTLIDLTATADHDTFEIVASTDFDGDVTSVQITRETLASAPQGAFEYRFAALNADAIGSAVSGALTATII